MFQVQIKESSYHPSQISDLVRSGKQKNNKNRNKIKEGNRKLRPLFPNSNTESEIKTNNIQRQGSTNNNNKVEGLTHHVLSSSSTKISSQLARFPVFSVIEEMLLKRISIPNFVARYQNLSEYLFWIFSVLFLVSTINSV